MPHTHRPLISARPHRRAPGLAPLLLLVALSGCATLVNDETVPITIHAAEPETTVKANGQWYETPATVFFPRGRGSQPLVFRKEGYNDTTVFLRQDADSAIWGDVFWPIIGLIFMGIDYGSGKGYTLLPETAYFSFHAPEGLFEPESAPATADSGDARTSAVEGE